MWHIHDSSDWFLMAVVMALFWAPLALLGFWAVAQLGPRARRRGEDQPDEPREIARRAYARGELDRERFHQIIADLEGSASTGGDDDDEQA